MIVKIVLGLAILAFLFAVIDNCNSDRSYEKIIPLFKDPNLLSDDEVFLDSAASTVTSSTGLTSPVPAPTRGVVIRAQTTAVAQIVRGISTF